MRTWLEVNLDQLEKNLNIVRAELPEKCSIIAVVKANAYGHGYEPVTKKLYELGLRHFAVACMDEAMQLRRAGIGGDIIVLGNTEPQDALTAAQNDITLAVVSPENLESLAAAVSSGDNSPSEISAECRRPLKVHIAVNTGMNRIGFDCKTGEQLQAIADAYRKYNGPAEQSGPEGSNTSPIRITGIFSHFSSADDTSEGADPYTKLQLSRYEKVLAHLAHENIAPGLRHISNSGGIGKYPQARFDAVRCGALIYGYNTAMDAKLPVQPAMQWKTAVSVVRTIDEGDAVSYSRKYIAKGPRTIATICIGYADGLSRQLSGKGYVLINGMRAPMIGNICMDQMMVDVTEIQLQAAAGRTNAVVAGTEAVIIGRSGNLIQTADDSAEIQRSCMHEVLSTIGQRVERYYR